MLVLVIVDAVIAVVVSVVVIAVVIFVVIVDNVETLIQHKILVNILILLD